MSIVTMRQIGAAVRARAKLWWNLRKCTYERMERLADVRSATGHLDPSLTVVAPASMVEQFSDCWFMQAELHGNPTPRGDDAADVLSGLRYRMITANILPSRPRSTKIGRLKCRPGVIII